MSNYETDMMDDLFADEAEGPAQAYDEFDDFSEADDFDELDEFGEADSDDQFDAAGDLADEGYDAYDDAAGEDAIDAMEEAMTDALAADDTDEFVRRFRQGLRRVVNIARQAAPVVGQIARTVAPIASALPIPQAQAIGRIAGVVGRLMADEADEFEALDEMFDLAEGNIDAAAPVIAGLTIRRAVPNIARMSRPARRNLMRGVTQATRAVARRQGPQAARVMPAVVRRVQTAVNQRRIPPRAAPQAIQRTAVRVASNPAIVRRLTAAARPALRRPTRRRRSYTLNGPVTITIRGR